MDTLLADHPSLHCIHEVQNGHCWAFAGGGEGQLGVALASPILMEEVTVDHVAKSIAFDMRSAPRQMEVWGLDEGKDDDICSCASTEGRSSCSKRSQTTKWGKTAPLHMTEMARTAWMGYHDSYEVDYPKTPPKYPEYIVSGWRISRITSTLRVTCKRSL